VFAFFFLSLLLATALLRGFSSTLHWRTMLRHHLLLVVLSIHLLLTTHHLLIHRLLVVTSAHVFGSFVMHLGLVSFSDVLIAVVFAGVLVAMFLAAHSCSQAAMFSHVPGPASSFSGSSFASNANALSGLAVLRAFGLVE